MTDQNHSNDDADEQGGAAAAAEEQAQAAQQPQPDAAEQDRNDSGDHGSEAPSLFEMLNGAMGGSGRGHHSRMMDFQQEMNEHQERMAALQFVIHLNPDNKSLPNVLSQASTVHNWIRTGKVTMGADDGGAD